MIQAILTKACVARNCGRPGQHRRPHLSFRPTERSVAREGTRLRQELYAFIESGIPVIVCMSDDPAGNLDGHAVVVVGHSLPCFDIVRDGRYVQPAKSFITGVADSHYLVSTLVPLYYVHDDAYGPFNRLLFAADGGEGDFDATRTELNLRSDAELLYPVMKVGGKSATSRFLMDLVVPVPPMIHAGSVPRLTELLHRFDEIVLKGLKREFGPEMKLLWRSLLLEGADFKASTVRRGFGEDIISWYAAMMLPKYVWLFEFSLVLDDSYWPEQFNPDRDREILGKVIVDPTTPSYDFRCLAFRVRQLGYDYRPREQEAAKLCAAAHFPVFTLRATRETGATSVTDLSRLRLLESRSMSRKRTPEYRAATVKIRRVSGVEKPARQTSAKEIVEVAAGYEYRVRWGATIGAWLCILLGFFFVFVRHDAESGKYVLAIPQLLSFTGGFGGLLVIVGAIILCKCGPSLDVIIEETPTGGGQDASAEKGHP